MIKIAGTEWEILRILYSTKGLKAHELLANPIRNIDIANKLKVSEAMISKSISGLETMGLVERNGKIINLTKTGIWYAEFYEKVKKHGTG